MSSHISPIIKNEEDRITAVVALDGKIVIATLDTGSSHSFISKKLADELWTKEKITSTKSLVCLANGQLIPVTQALIMIVSMGSNESVVELLILPDAIDAVYLGLDFLKTMNAKLTIGEHAVSLCRSNLITSTNTPRILRDQLLPQDQWPNIVSTSVANCMRSKAYGRRVNFMIKTDQVRYRVKVPRSGMAKVFIMAPKIEGNMIAK